MAVYIVRVTQAFEKSLRTIPRHIAVRGFVWIEKVRKYGLEEVRKNPGLHDEPLVGKHLGKRSIRLNRSYRLFYRILEIDDSVWVEVMEINHHDY